MVGRCDTGDHRRRSGPGEDIEHHIGAGDALGQRFGSGGFEGIEPVDHYCGQDLDHLAVAVVAALQAAPQPLQRGRQRKLLERRAVAQRTGLLREYRHIVPGIVNGLVAPEPPIMLGDDITPWRITMRPA